MEFRSAQTVDEAVDLLAEHGADAQLLAGGTDVMIQHQRGEIHPGALLHIGGIAALKEFSNGSGLRIGSGVTHRTLARDPVITRAVPGLAQAAATVGGWQTQAVGTVGGNVCNASPAADTVPPLLTAAARVVLASRSGERTVDLAEFITGRRQTARRPDELVTRLHLEPLPPRSSELYLKVGPRRAMEVALVGLAVRLSLAEDGRTMTDVRIATCAVSPRPFRSTAAEEILEGEYLDRETLRAAGSALAASADPIDDARASARYRRRVLAPLLARAVERCHHEAQERKA